MKKRKQNENTKNMTRTKQKQKNYDVNQMTKNKNCSVSEIKNEMKKMCMGLSTPVYYFFVLYRGHIDDN